MDTNQTISPTSVPRSRHGLKQLMLGLAGLALAFAVGVALWSNRGPVVTRPKPPVTMRQAIVPLIQRSNRSAAAAPVVFVATSVEGASTFQAALLQVTDGAESLHARVVTPDGMPSVLSENVWREATGLPVVRVVDLTAAEEADR